MSAETLSGIGTAVGGAMSAGVETMGPAIGGVASGVAEPMGSLGNFATESVPSAFENAFTDISILKRGFAEPTIESPMGITEESFRDAINGIDATEPDLSIYENAFAEPTAESPFEITDETFKDAIKGIDVAEPDISIFEKAFEPNDLNVESFQNIEDVIESPNLQAEVENGISSQSITELTPMQLESVKADLEVAKDVKGMLIDIGFDENTASEISQKSLETALERKGISVNELTQAEFQAEPETESAVETQIMVQSTEVQTETEKKDKEKKKEKEKNNQPQEIVLFVKDEKANAERKKDSQQAINKAFSEEDKEKDGSEVVARMNATPTDEETSEIVRRIAGNVDGSYDEVLEGIKSKRFSSKDEAEKTINSLIENKPAVKLEKSGKTVSERDVKRVLRTNYPTLSR